MAMLDERIAVLSDQQSLSILNSLAGEFSEYDIPEGRDDQAAALRVITAEGDQDVDIIGIAKLDTPAGARIARRLLALVARIPECRRSLTDRLDQPPRQESAVIPVPLDPTVILTGCLVVLQIVGHIHFKRHRDGEWEVEYDPSKKAALDQVMMDMIPTLTTEKSDTGLHE